MGCGISTFNLVDEGMPCGLRPLRRKIDRMDRATTDAGTASTKLLLKDNGDADAVIDSNDGRKSVSHDHALPLKEPPLAQQIRSKEDTMITSNAKKLSSDDREKGVEAQKVEIKYNKEEDIMGEGNEEVEDDDDGDDRGRRISNYDGSSWMGSPSFREYCVPNPESETEDAIEDGGNSDGRKRENKKQESDNFSCTDEICVRSPASESPSLESPSEVKKESRGRRFIKVFPMHRPKNFWNGRNNVNVSSPKLPQKVM